MPKKSHSLYLGLATGGIPHSIRVTKKAATGLSVVFTFIKKHFNKAEKDQDLGKKKKKKRWEKHRSTGDHKPHKCMVKLITGSVLAGSKTTELRLVSRQLTPTD